MSAECARCKELQQRIDRLTEELAAQRERANALFVAYPPQAREPAPPAPADPKPLRYELADSINEMVSRFPGYGLARRAAQLLTRP